MLDPHAHRHVLGFQKDAGGGEHLEGIPPRMPGGEQNVRNGVFSAVLSGKADRPYFSVPDLQPRERRLKINAAAEGQKLPAQAVAPHVRLAVVQNFLRRAVRYERAEHFFPEGALHPRIQLAVRKRARAALAELNVGRGIEHAGGVKGGNILLPLFHGLAALRQKDV